MVKKFVVKESKFVSRVKSRWRFPRGKHSKVRQMHKGRPALPNPGYGAPVATKGLDKRSGKRPVVVYTVSQLSSLNSSTEGVIIATQVGMKKQKNILLEAEKKGLSVLNIKNSTEKIKEIDSKIETRKKRRKDLLTRKNKRSSKKENKKESKKENKKEDGTPEKESKKSSDLKSTESKQEKEKKEKEMAEKTIIKPQ